MTFELAIVIVSIVSCIVFVCAFEYGCRSARPPNTRIVNPIQAAGLASLLGDYDIELLRLDKVREPI
jgi:hypothetical protein